MARSTGSATRRPVPTNGGRLAAGAGAGGLGSVDVVETDHR